MLLIGKTLKAQGIKGEIKVLPMFDDPALFKSVKKLIIDGTHYEVEGIRIGGEFAYIKLKGVDDRNAAELVRGEIHVEDEDKPELPDGRFYIADVVGCVVVDGTEVLGTITDIMQYGSADVYCVEGTEGKKSFMFPFVQGVIEKVDLAIKIVYINAVWLARVAVYED